MGVVSSRVQPVGSRWAADGSRQTCRRRFGTSNPLLSPAAGTVVLRCTALAPVVAVGEEHLTTTPNASLLLVVLPRILPLQQAHC